MLNFLFSLLDLAIELNFMALIVYYFLTLIPYIVPPITLTVFDFIIGLLVVFLIINLYGLYRKFKEADRLGKLKPILLILTEYFWELRIRLIICISLIPIISPLLDMGEWSAVSVFVCFIFWMLLTLPEPSKELKKKIKRFEK